MGISLQPLRLLVKAQQAGVDFTNVATLGRHHLNLTEKQISATFSESGVFLDKGESSQILASEGGCSESLFQHLGAREITSFDASHYEGASVVHDFNERLPEEYHQRYSLVVDSGSLEHVFNFPCAIGNLMQAVRLGGHLLLCTPANNYCGHGFYQFSPELFYRVFSAQSGFKVEGLYLTYGLSPDWHEVADPAVVGGRVFCHSRKATLIGLLVRRIAAVDPFELPAPQQSDYASTWASNTTPKIKDAKKAPGKMRRLIKSMVPGQVLTLRSIFRKWLWRRAFESRALKSVPWNRAFS